jgi:thiamine biosynthesis lipoprotein
MDRLNVSTRDNEPVPAQADPGRLLAHSHLAMGTEFTVYLDLSDEAQARACFQAAFDEIDRIEYTFSRFRLDSEISRLNQFASDGPVVTDPEVFEVLTSALDVSAKTDGAFDITVGKLTRAWGFANRQPAIPAVDALAEAMQCTGWTHVELDKDWRTVRFLRPGIELDLGAIAKGYAVDRAIEVLRSAGVSALVNAGASSIAATDESITRGWNVAIPNPADSLRTLCEVQLGIRALSTSGVKEQHFIQDGRLYSHLIDPTAHLRSEDAAENTPKLRILQVTVLAPTSILADALSTAMFLLGASRGSAILPHFDGCSALWIYSDVNGISWLAHKWPENTLFRNSKGN